MIRILLYLNNVQCPHELSLTLKSAQMNSDYTCCGVVLLGTHVTCDFML